MEEIVRMVHKLLEDKKMTSDEYMQLCKICEKEDLFAKDLPKDKWKEYFNLDIEKGQLHNHEIDYAIEITYKVCKKIFSQNFD